jgi:hypothetical protein
VDDVAVGAALGLLVALAWLHYHPTLDAFIEQAGPEGPAVVLGSIVGALALTRAQPPAPTPSRRQSANISGLASGMLLATWAVGRSGTHWPEQHALRDQDVADRLLLFLARMTIGLGVAFGGELLIKKLMTPAVPPPTRRALATCFVAGPRLKFISETIIYSTFFRWYHLVNGTIFSMIVLTVFCSMEIVAIKSNFKR